MKIRDRIKEFRRVPAGELRPNPANWRTHPEAQQNALRGVLAEVGIAAAVIARELPDGTLELIDGHLRTDVLPGEEIPTLILDVNEAEAAKLLATFDPLGKMAAADPAKLDALLREVETGSEALSELLAELAAEAGLYQEEAEIIEDEAPAPPVDPITESGDLWILGEHRLLCGDSTNAADVERAVDGAKVDLWITDPPYNVDYTGKTKDALKVSNDSMANDAFREFLSTAFRCAIAHMKPGASFYIWHADSEGYNFHGAVHDCGEKVRQCLIWKKQRLVMGRQDYHYMHEPCLYGWKKGASHGWYTDRKQTTVLEFDRPSRSSEHPTMKPVALLAYQIGNSTAPQGVVLDSFLGSSTTIVACEQLGRRCCGLELDPAYCDVSALRWMRLTGKPAHCERKGKCKKWTAESFVKAQEKLAKAPA